MTEEQYGPDWAQKNRWWVIGLIIVVALQIIVMMAWTNFEEGRAVQPLSTPVTPTPDGGRPFLPVLLGNYQHPVDMLANTCPQARPGDLVALLIPCDEG